MANNNIKVNQDRLLCDLYLMRQYFCTRSTKRDLILDMNGFLVLNNTFGILSGKQFNQDDIYKLRPNLQNELIRKSEKNRNKFYNYFLNEADVLFDIGCNYNDMLCDINFNNLPIFSKQRKYSEKDFKDIILAFFATFNDQYYNIVKKYFDEGRISMGEVDSDYALGYYGSISSLESGYIFTIDDELNSKNASVLVHELGHAIDSETFLFPQQKNMHALEDYYLELPSTCFENIFAQYLIDNKIDVTGGLVINNYLANMTDLFLGDVEECLATSPLIIDKNGLVETTDNNLVNFREGLLYGLGHYIAFNLNEIYRNDPKEFNKIFYNIISTRKEITLEKLIELTDLDINDFVSSTLIKDTLEENTNKLRKRFNYYA